MSALIAEAIMKVCFIIPPASCFQTSTVMYNVTPWRLTSNTILWECCFYCLELCQLWCLTWMRWLLYNSFTLSDKHHWPCSKEVVGCPTNSCETGISRTSYYKYKSRQQKKKNSDHRRLLLQTSIKFMIIIKIYFWNFSFDVVAFSPHVWRTTRPAHARAGGTEGYTDYTIA